MNETGIANLALGRIGIGQQIASLSEQSTPAKRCNEVYHQCRQELLRGFPWGFTLRCVALAQTTQVFPGWGFVYQYPAKCLMVRAIGDQYGLRYATTSTFCCDQSQWPAPLRTPYQIALKDDEASQVILTDLESAYAFYTADVANTGVFTSDFVSCFADRIAMEIGGPLQAKADLIQVCEGRLQRNLSWARAQAMNEAKDDPKPESVSITCRL